MPTISISKIVLRPEIIDRKDWVKYLVIPEWHLKALGRIVERVPDKRFNAFVEEHVQSYLNGTAPPATIQSAVMNIADAYASGQDVTIGAGDYVALQTEFQSEHRTK
jgi:hypothetical protein